MKKEFFVFGGMLGPVRGGRGKEDPVIPGKDPEGFKGENKDSQEPQIEKKTEN